MAEQTDSKVPQIRFKGFEEEWVEAAVSNFVVTLDSGVSVNAGDSRSASKEEFGILKTSAVTKGRFEPEENKVVLAATELSRLKEPVLCGTIIICRKNTPELVGANNYVETSHKNLFLPDLLWVAKPKEGVSMRFLAFRLGSEKGRTALSKLARGGSKSMSNITKPSVLALPVMVSSPAEQTKIGGYFKELDGMIALHQRKHRKLVTLKQAMLRKMFPQNGATTPEIRFKGFSEPWVEKTVEDVSNRYDNLRIPISAGNRTPGRTPYYGANGIQDYVKGFTHEGEFILIAEDGANDLKNYPVQFVRGKIWVNNHAHVLQAKSNVADTQFIGLSFSQKDIEQFLVGGGRAKLNANTMMKIVISLPQNINEQQKIGSYFRQLDTLISKHATQLEKLKQIKSACLEKMFV